MDGPTSHAIVVTVVPATPAPARTVANVVFGALAFAGLLFLLAMALGAVLATLRYGWLRWHPPADDHMPPISSQTAGPAGPPSSQAQ